MKHWDLLAVYDAETQAWSEAANAAAPSPYSPGDRGRLVGIRIIVGQQAATSLTDNVLFRLSCTKWTPNAMIVGAAGGGLCTATKPECKPVDFEVEQPVEPGVPIHIEGRLIDATAVTVEVMIFGCFVN